MTVHTLRRQQLIEGTPEQVFGFFEKPENLERITPPWLSFRILSPLPITMAEGTVIDYTIRWLGVPLRWRTVITAHEAPYRFVDEQWEGPYALWQHTHQFEGAGDKTAMTDSVRYALRGGPLGSLAHALIVRRQLEQVFDYRANTIARLLRA